MRTTLTLDDDVAAQIEALRRQRGVSLKTLINQALRKGLAEMERSAKHRAPRFETRVFDPGPPLLPNIDNVADVLAVIEGERFK
jgi:hypothetical protein